LPPKGIVFQFIIFRPVLILLFTTDQLTNKVQEEKKNPSTSFEFMKEGSGNYALHYLVFWKGHLL
jgi:hypothetical protein